MAVTNASLSALAAARNDDTTPPYSLVPGSPSGTYSLNDYEITGISITGVTSVNVNDYEIYTLNMTGGSRRDELRLVVIHATWIVTGASKDYDGNDECGVAFSTASGDTTVTLECTWNDGYNVERYGYLDVYVNP
jgi:hypothetical protein